MNTTPRISTKLRQVHYAMIGVMLAVLLIGFGSRHNEPMTDTAAPKKVSFLIVMKSQVDTSSATSISDFNSRKQTVYNALVQHALKTQADVRAVLDSKGIKYRAYYLTSALAVNADQDVRDLMNARSDVAYTLELPNLQPLDTVATDEPIAVNPTGQESGDIEPVYPVEGMDAQDAEANIWGVPFIGADKVWSDLGVNGQGVIVGSADTGVDWTHPDLKPNYLGSENNHDFTWYDPWKNGNTPVDWHGHGTHTTGTMVGQNGIGVAPGAKWIGCESLGMNYGNAAYYMDCMQFLFAPFAHTSDAFHGDVTRGAMITNNSWGCPAIERCDATVLANALKNLANAGQLNVFAAGNSGPTCSTIGNPGYNDSVLSVGAIEKTGKITSFSSRGPVLLDGSGRVRPDVAAPGSEVYSSFPGGKYSTAAGTSMAAPHVAGLVALMWSANPELRGDVEATMNIIRGTAKNVTITDKEACGGSTGIPNNVYGYGLASAFEAVQQAEAYHKK